MVRKRNRRHAYMSYNNTATLNCASVILLKLRPQDNPFSALLAKPNLHRLTTFANELIECKTEKGMKPPTNLYSV